jgi:hypothetical protein
LSDLSKILHDGRAWPGEFFDVLSLEKIFALWAKI